MTPARLHLAVDLSESEHQPTGVGTFATELVDRWLADVPAGDLELSLCVRDADALPERWSASGARICSAGRPEAHPIRWQQTTLRTLVRKLRPDVFFGPAYSLPHALGVPAAVALHDLSFERFPEAWHWRERWRRRLLARSAAKRAERVLTISQFSARELRELYGTPEDRIVVVPLGVRTDLEPADESACRALRERLRLDPELPVILHLGTLLARRNVPQLARAVAALRQPAQLLVVGHNRTRPALDLNRLAADTGLGDRLVHVPYVEADELSAVYSLAAVYASLSSYEGFGLPVLEAIACGTPALVLEVGASRELWGEHAHLVDAVDPDTVARGLETVLERPELGLRARDRALERHTWSRSAAQVLATLREIAR